MKYIPKETLKEKTLKVFFPVLYLAVWLVFVYTAQNVDLIHTIDSNLFLILSFLVLFFEFIIKSSAWAIGNQLFNISGESKRHVEYS